MSGLGPAGDEHGEGIAPARSAGRHAHVCEPAAFEELSKCVDRKAQMTIAEPGPDPGLIVGLEIHQEQPSARPQHADRFRDGAFGVAGMVQRLREQRDVVRGVAQRQPRQVALPPLDVGHLPLGGQRLRALEHIVGAIDAGDTWRAQRAASRAR